MGRTAVLFRLNMFTEALICFKELENNAKSLQKPSLAATKTFKGFH